MRSISSSFSRAISVPSLSMALMPLNSGGLCDAVITTPPATLPVLTANWSVGVGTRPQSMTLHPVAINPEAQANFSISLEVLASVPIMTVPFMKVPMAMPSLMANWLSIWDVFTTPLPPFVPNSLGACLTEALKPLMFESQIKPSYMSRYFERRRRRDSRFRYRAGMGVRNPYDHLTLSRLLGARSGWASRNGLSH